MKFCERLRELAAIERDRMRCEVIGDEAGIDFWRRQAERLKSATLTTRTIQTQGMNAPRSVRG